MKDELKEWIGNSPVKATIFGGGCAILGAILDDPVLGLLGFIL